MRDTPDTAPRPAYARLVLAACALLLFFGGLGAFPLLEPDEGRYAEIPREMLAMRDFVTPRLNGVLYFEKPPLYYWLNAAALSVLERPEVACRLASACFGLAGVGLAWVLGLSIGGRRTALGSAVVLGTSPFWLALSRADIIDMTLSFFLCATLVCFWLAQEREKRAPGERLAWYGMFLAAALATLTKGLIGFVIPGVVIFFYLLFARRWRLLLRVPWIGGVALFLLVAAPWHVLAARRNPDFLWYYFVHEHLLRYATPEANRQQPVWYFAAVLALGLLPWSGLLPAAGRLYRRGGAGRLRDRPGLIFLACWAGFVFLFFSASQSKVMPYILPAFPPLAVLIALGMEEREGRSLALRIGGALGALVLTGLATAFLWASLGKVERFSSTFTPSLFLFALPALAAGLLATVLWARQGVRRLWAMAAVPALILGCLWALAPRIARRNSAAEIGRVIASRARPGGEVYAYRCYPQTVPVYTRRLIGAVAFVGELEFGIGHLSPEERARRFPSPEQFRPLWSSDNTVYLVLEKSDLPRMPGDGLAPGPILMEREKYLLMTNR
jgi:4-amino-4-deoxy-L-arabinose transferase-like glycosyltransferase